MSLVVTYDVPVCTLEQSAPKILWRQDCLESVHPHGTTQHCTEMPTLISKAVELLAQNYDWTNTPHWSGKPIHSDLCHPDIAIIAAGYTTSTATALFGISELCSTEHHRHSSSLSKLHLMTDYHNLELRLHSLKILQWFTEFKFWHPFFSWSAPKHKPALL